jgi:hypothetical protein
MASGDDNKKKEMTATLCDMVLANLQPFSRSRLYTQKEETSLSNAVQNKSETDRYQSLGIDKTASAAAIKQAYTEESSKWNPTTNSSPEAKQKYEEVQKAYQILSDPISKQSYDVAGVEPTMEYKLIRPDVFYVHMTKFSPTSVEELARVMDRVKDKPENLNSLIFDLRNNVGGSIDILPYFLGPFIGYDQYAYQFLHQGEKVDFKTKSNWLSTMVRYKKVVILINENSQSTAETMASVLKKYNVGVVVGVPSKGWGTIEKVFPLNSQLDPTEHYSVFLVHSLSIREDGQPIEGKGVEPRVDIRTPNWTNDFLGYFNDPNIVSAVKEVLEK